MDHGLPSRQRVLPDLLRIAKELGLPIVATNDLHYTNPEDADTHEALLAIQSGVDPRRSEALPFRRQRTST